MITGRARAETSKNIKPAHKDEIWKETIRKEKEGVKKWNDDWEFLVDEYRKLEVQLRETCVQKVISLPETRHLKSHPPLPVTTAGDIGWLSSRPEMTLETYGDYCRRIVSLHKKLGWPIEAVP